MKKLTAQEEMVLTDMAAFLQWSIKNFAEHHLSFQAILSNLNHDINTAGNGTPFFIPKGKRSRGYYLASLDNAYYQAI